MGYTSPCRTVARADGEPGTLKFSEQLIPGRIYDVLETHCGNWFTIEAIVGYFPDEKAPTIRRAVERLITAGAFECRRQHEIEADYLRRFPAVLEDASSCPTPACGDCSEFRPVPTCYRRPFKHGADIEASRLRSAAT